MPYRIVAFLIIFFHLIFLIPVFAFAQNSQIVPFVHFGDKETLFTLAYNAGNKTFSINFEEDKFVAPRKFVPLQIVSSKKEGEFLVFGRDLISGLNNLQLLDINKDRWTRIELNYDERANYFFQEAFLVGDQVFLLVYDVVRNTPSGRRISGLSQGLDLYQVSITGTKAMLVPVKIGLPLGGLYVNPLIADSNNAKIICTQTACIKIGLDKRGFTYNLIENEKWAGKSLLELASDGKATFGLFRLNFDDRLTDMPKAKDPVFFICPIDNKSACDPIDADIIPYNLRVNSGKTSFTSAVDESDFYNLLNFDLKRMPRSGIVNLGNNNLEGTIPWNQVYLLNALIDIANGQVKVADAQSELTNMAKDRLRVELDLIADLGRTNYPWYFAKRYSLNREPISSVVHIGRIVRLLSRAEEIDGIGDFQDVLCDLAAELANPIRLMEELRNKPTERPELRIKHYQPFWSDGSNVPWNYQSAWIDGIVYGQQCATISDLNNFVTRLINLFIEEENLLSLPRYWNYASGDFLAGWTIDSNISSNTPIYAGDKQNTTTAHISYRSMDVMALLAAQRIGLTKTPNGFVEHVRKLIEEGWLYPFVAEELLPFNERPNLPFSTARLFSRSVLSWELQNQVWAIDALINQTGQR